MESNSGPSIIFLIGMPGVGKSYWAHKCAQYYGLQHLDTDDLIQKLEQKSVSDIFKVYGETYFRKKETEILENIVYSTTANTIVSCGGGTPCFNNNLEFLNQKGFTVYLKSGIDFLVMNLLKDTNQRPMFLDKEKLPFDIEKLLSARSQYYEQAKYTLQVEDIDITKFEKIITSCTNRQF